ncbi:MAG: hypothetical protein K0U74_16525 [Alphaproteobacteria bacterium]|nr:hypothetical protein [Alphaproteobacteria bacterium]
MQLQHRPEDFPGFFPTVLWVGIGVFLFWTTPGAAFLSWQTLVYFVVGTIAVGILFGVIGMTLQRMMPSLKPRPDSDGKPSQTAQLIGTLVGAVQMVVVYFLAKAVVTQILFAPNAI